MNTLRLASLSVLALAFSGCADMSKIADSVPMPNIKALAPEPVKVGVLPPAPEHKWANLDDDLKENRAAGDGLVLMPKLESYLNGLYDKLKASADVPSWPGKVYIMADRSLNAHSSPSGNLYINLALIQSADTEDEIFAILSHEFAHVYLNHQVAHDSKFLVGTVGTVGKVLAGLLDSDKNPTGWRAGDGIGLIQDLADNLVLPSWQRSTEEEADRLGATLSLKNNYSYAAGFKAFLERLAPLESEDAIKKAAKNKADLDTFTRTGSFRSAKSTASKSTGDELKTDVSRLIMSMPKQALQNHADAVAREEALSAEVAPLLQAGPRAKPHKTEWDAARRDKSTAAILQNYAYLKSVDDALSSQNYRQAYALAQRAASGPTRDHGMPVVALYRVMELGSIGTPQQRLEILLRNQNAVYPSWGVQTATAALIAQTDQAKGLAYLKSAQERFGYPESTFPYVIVALAEHNDVKSAQDVSRICVQKAPRMALACMGSARTTAEKQQALAKDEAHKTTLTDNLKTKLFGN